MARPPETKNVKPIDPRWLDTVQAGVDASESVHVRPQRSAADVAKLTRGLKTIVDTEPAAGAPAPKAEKGGPGVAGKDFFAFGDVLGRGGMGQVYRARQGSMSREVAVKMLRDGGVSDPTLAGSFLREALTTGALAHPNIVPVHFFGSDEHGQPFMVMKRVQGKAWNELLSEADKRAAASGEFDIRTHLEIFLKVCDAIAFAHSNFIVHRDLKPGNVMVGDFGEVTVMDWGLAFDCSPEGDRGLAIPKKEASAIAGTPAYMAPEMVRCDLDLLGPATDIYLLGATLHEILTGRPPHLGEDVLKVLEKAASGKLDPLKARRGLTAEVRPLEAIIETAMAPDPSQRYSTVAALEADVRAFLAGQGNRRESEALTQAAREELTALTEATEDLLVTSQYYPRCSEIVAKAQQAMTLWGLNPRAVRVRQEALAAFANLAVRGKDWGLAESLLRDLRLSGSGGHALATPIDGKLRELRHKARVREYLVQRMARLAAIATVFMAGLSIYLYWQGRLLEERYRPPADRDEPEQPERPESEKTVTTAQPRPSPVYVPAPAPKFAPGNLCPWRSADEPREFLPIDALSINSASQLLIVEGTTALWLWESRGPAAARLLSKNKTQEVIAACWADMRTVVLGCVDGQVLAGEVPSSGTAQWKSLANLESPVHTVTARRDAGALIVSAASEKRVLIAPPGLPVRTEDGIVRGLQYLPDGKLICVTESGIRGWLPGGRHFDCPLNGAFARAVIARYAPVVVLLPANRKDEIHVFRLDMDNAKATGTVLGRLVAQEISAMASSPDGNLVAVGSPAGELALVSVTPARILSKAKAHEIAVQALAFSDDSSMLFSADAAGRIHAWQIANLRR